MTSQRLKRLTKYIDRNTLGLEIAPFFNPAVPKSAGYNVLILDISTTAELRNRAFQSEHIPDERVDEIEEVDIVGDASNLTELIAKKNIDQPLQFIVSSHNFEHLPNPLKFLKGCAEVLPEGGVVSMAIPDYRACFDHFRFPTRLSDWLRAYRADISAPDPETVFDYVLNKSTYRAGDTWAHSTSLQSANPARFEVDRSGNKAFELYSQQLSADAQYVDVHCTVSFGATFELMIRDLAQHGMLDLEILEISQTFAHEYFVHLRKSSSPAMEPEQYNSRRSELLAEIDRGLGPLAFDRVRTGVLSGYVRRPRTPKAFGQMLATKLIGEDRFEAWRERNRQRKTRRRLARKQA